jgi:PAS domain S-box-containing protein
MNKDKNAGHLFPISSGDILRVALFVALYFIAFKISYLFPDAESILMVIWPAGGIGLAALLLSPRRLWPVIISAFFLVGNISNLMIDRPLFNSIGFMIANVTESYLCAWLIVRWCGEDIRFTTVKEISALIFAATVVNACTAFIGGGTAWLAGLFPFWSFWQSWWISDGLGILIVAPLVVTWSTLRDITIRDQWKKGIEVGIFMAIWFWIAQISFQVQASDDPFAAKPYLLFALLAYAAIRLGQRGVTATLVILLIISITSEAIRTGPSYLGGDTMNDRLLLLQVYISCIAITGFIIAASYSESKSAERSSREGQSRIRALGDNIPNGMVYQVVREHDGSMRFLYLSAGIEKLEGISAEEALRDPSKHYNLFVEEDRSIVAASEEVSARDMSTFNVVVRIRRPDGQLRWMQMSSSPRRLEDGRIMWDGIQMDITERKQVEEELKKYREDLEELIKERTIELDSKNEELRKHRDNLEKLVKERTAQLQIAKDHAEESDRLKSRFLAMMSHELRTPLNAIIGFSDLMMHGIGGNINETHKGYARDINNAGEHLLVIIDDILDLSKVEAGKMKLVIEKFSVHELLEETLILIKNKAIKHHIDIIKDIDPQLEFMEGDESKIKQVLFNLLSNALKFSKEDGGTITVAVKRIEGMVRFSVSDTGIGIEKQNLDKLFQEFQQVDSSISRKYGGTGLGLVISKKLIELHGGEIWAHSVFGEGSTFTFSIPIQREVN